MAISSIQVPVSIGSMVESAFARIKARCERPAHLPGVPSSFGDLDLMLDGLQASSLTIVAGRPSMGCSSFVLNIAQHIAIEQNLPVIIFALDATKEQLVQRMLCTEGNIKANKLRVRQIDDDEQERLANAKAKLLEVPLYIDDSIAITTTDILRKCRQMESNIGRQFELVIIDDIPNLKMPEQPTGELQKIDPIQELKNLACHLNVPVIAVSRVSRAADERENKRPQLSDLQESGVEFADTILFIYRDEYYYLECEENGIAEIIIARNRMGPTGTIHLTYDSHVSKFSQKSGC